jgi:hypothetical protein
MSGDSTRSRSATRDAPKKNCNLDSTPGLGSYTKNKRILRAEAQQKQTCTAVFFKTQLKAH